MDEIFSGSVIKRISSLRKANKELPPNLIKKLKEELEALKILKEITKEVNARILLIETILK